MTPESASTPDRAAIARAWGVAPGYHDISGRWSDVPAVTEEALLAAMGAQAGPPPGSGAGDDPVAIVRQGEERALPGGPFILTTEDGGTVKLNGATPTLPPDLPLGYHRLGRLEDGWERLVAVSPGRCHLPEDLRTWGWAVQLYAARSRTSWGMGDLADLGRLGRWSKELGAGLLLLNPLHATVPSGPQDSPYYPSSRCFRNPSYLRVEDVPGASATDLGELGVAGRALNADRRIDRAQVWKLKADALGRLWGRFRATGGDLAFDAFVTAGGEALFRFAVHCALDEHHPGSWRDWPEALRRPDGAAVARFASEQDERVRFHMWLQWLTENQVRAAGAEIDLVTDLAVGTDPGGADAWMWQDCLALSARVGAPPDEFNTKGQDWGVPPFDPWRLRMAGYEPYVRMLRAAFAGAGGVRIDHVMGLFRLYWIPLGASATEGGYVGYRYDEMLDLLALESARAGAWVVGEDLGTVEGHVRHELWERAVLSYRLVCFEPGPTESFPHQAMAAVTTHDLPTVAGLWTGTDLEEQRALELSPNEEAQQAMRDKLAGWTGLEPDAPVERVVEEVHAFLGRAPSMVLTATLEDAAGVEERPNLPGTLHERPNWSLALPMALEDLEESPLARAVARALTRAEDLEPDETH